MARNFTRQEFYDLIWSKPVTHIAKEFVLSDVAIHKICKKHNIPTPPPGWWAKKSAGKAVHQTPLPFSILVELDSIRIVAGEYRQESPLTAQAREHARVVASDLTNEKIVDDPLVTCTLATLTRGKTNAEGLVAVAGSKLIKCSVAPTSIERLTIILPRVASAALQQGFRLEAGSKSARFASDSETVEVVITEGINRVEHVPTGAERAKLEIWEKKREKAHHRNQWDAYFHFDKPEMPLWDYHPNGVLTVELEHVSVWPGTSPRRTFRDTKTKRLEDLVADIAVGLAVLAAAKTDQRIKREEQARRAEVDRKQRENAARTNHVERRRTEELSKLIAELDELDRLKRLIAMLSGDLSQASEPRVRNFIEWAQRHLAGRREALLPQMLEGRFADNKLFGEDDDFGFYPRGF